MVWRILASATVVAALLTLASIGTRHADPLFAARDIARGPATDIPPPEPEGERVHRSQHEQSDRGRSAGKLLWVGDLETGDLSQFAETPWNQVGSPDPHLVTDPGLVRDGAHALAFTIPAGGNRNEVVPDTAPLEPGDDLYFGFSTMLGRGFPVDQEWQVVTQWKNNGKGSPPLSLSIGDGKYLLHGGYGHPDGSMEFSRPLARAVVGEWSDWIFHIRFSSDPEVGFVEVWRNGTLVLPRYHPASGTLYPELDSYIKTGYYRDPAIDIDGTLYLDNWRIGTTRTIAARARG